MKKQYTIINESCLDALDKMEENSIDAIVTDPPYEISFMSKKWDNTGIAFNVETWKKALRVLKPGGHLLAFNHSRTFHRLAVAIEDAGFELRDTIMWIYGSGFPKSHNVGVAVDKKNEANNKWKGWGTALKPAFEPIVLARKPIKTSIADNVIKYGVGAINIDECRVTTGRFPANIIHDGSEEVISNFPEVKGSKGNGLTATSARGMYNLSTKGINRLGYNDSGSASRFFYTSKASKKDRNEGLDLFEEKLPAAADFRPNHLEKAIEGKEDNAFARWKPTKNIHPTVKPTDLMQYLIRLVAPKGAKILDLFMGSGSTGKAAMFENVERNANYHFIGIDLEKEYCDIAEARIAWAANYKDIKIEQNEKRVVNGKEAKQMSIFNMKLEDIL